jgi:CRISPR-associated endonuclease/helicase Cas3
MVVLNRKKDALAVMEALDDPGAYHLSTLLYPSHRRRVLAEIQQKLDRQEPCRLIATQVVEAGVDLDFPVVYRAVGPLDRIVQAAGRCNREGRSETGGRVVVFNPSEGGTPRGAYAAGLGNALSLLAAPGADLNDPGLYETYFKRLYQSVNTDAKKIQARREALDYPEVAEHFRMIDSPTAPVLIRNALLEEERALIEMWLERLLIGWGSPRTALRRLQPFTVNLYQQDLNRALRERLAAPLTAGLCEWLGKYDKRRGLTWDTADPADLIA